MKFFRIFSSFFLLTAVPHSWFPHILPNASRKSKLLIIFVFHPHLSSHSGRHHCVAYGSLWTRNFQTTKHDDEILWINFDRPISLVQPENSHLLANLPRIIHIENQLRFSTHSIRCIFMNWNIFEYSLFIHDKSWATQQHLLHLIHEKTKKSFR